MMVLDAMFGQLQSVAAGWTTEAERRRQISKVDPRLLNLIERRRRRKGTT